ncbi:phasin family protein [Coralliovum pocilloporae]|uniref:phasin family protein n=1 Tax=Coralliovum pocilloporae TaxID=3066369 RepID=UPI003306C7F3
MSKTPEVEIPEQVREMAEKSVEQARQTWEDFMGQSQQAMAKIENSSDTIQSGAAEINDKARSFAENSVTAAFDFAQAMARAKSLEEVVSLQRDYMQNQMKAFGENAREMGEAAMNTVNEFGKKASE